VPEILNWIHDHRSLLSEEEHERLYIWSPIILENPGYLDVRTVPDDVREESALILENYQPNNPVKNVWWEHGAEQVVKILRDTSMTDDKRNMLLQRFREFSDTMDRNRGTVWYETFLNIAQKVLL